MGDRQRALVVDGDPIIRLAVDRQLEALGWDSITVNTGGEAIRVAELKLRLDVLLTELILPDADGPALARMITTHSAVTRVAFMTALAVAEPPEPRHAPLLVKPFSTAALASALSRAVLLQHRGPWMI